MLCPIFPLNGAIMFPKTTLPLNIFEKRYIQLVDYALSNERIFGMIQTQDNGDLFKVGCLGKITSFQETDDNRYLISIEGLSFFNVVKEIKSEKLFRIIEAKKFTIENSKPEINQINKKNIIEIYKKYLKKKQFNFKAQELFQLETAELLKFIVMISPFSKVEKQMFLETKNITEFAEKLITTLDIYTNESYERGSLN